MRRFSPLLRALFTDRSGASAVEFIMVGALLMSMLQATMDMSLAYSTRLKLEQAAGRTAELVTAPGTVALNYTNLGDEASSAYGETLTSVTIDNWLECSGTRNASFTGSCATIEQTARYVSITLVDEYMPLFNWGGLISGSGPHNGFEVSGDATVRIQ